MEQLLRILFSVVLCVQFSVPVFALPQAAVSEEAGTLCGIDFSSGAMRLLYDGNVSRSQAKEDMKSFLTGVAFPLEDLLVDLNIYNLPSDVIDPALENTELGRVFLDADVKLKRLVKDAILDKGVVSMLEDTEMDSESPAFRVWIQPKSVEIIESKDKSSARIGRLYLGVNFEFSKNLPNMMKSVFENNIIPDIESKVNNGAEFSALRRSISAVLLADWYKKRASVASDLDSLKDSRYTRPVVSTKFWITRDFMDKYVDSYRNAAGEGDGIVGGVNPAAQDMEYIESADSRDITEDATPVVTKLSAILQTDSTDIGIIDSHLSGKSFSEMAKNKAGEIEEWIDRFVGYLLKEGITDENLEVRVAFEELIEEINDIYKNDYAGEVSFWAGALGGVFRSLNKQDYSGESEHLRWKILNNVLNLIGDNNIQQDILIYIFKDNSEDNAFISSGRRFLAKALSDAAKIMKEYPENAKQYLSKNIFHKIGFDGENPRLGWARGVPGEIIEQRIRPFKQKAKEKDYFIAVGMGGSINTVKLVSDMYGLDSIIAFDTPDKNIIEKTLAEKGVDLKDAVVVLFSKSGTTYETKAIRDILKSIIKNEDGEKAADIIKNNFLWVVDKGNEGKIEDKDIDVLYMQPDGLTDIGGRYTMPWTGVYLLPLYWRFKQKEELLSRDEKPQQKFENFLFFNLEIDWKNIISDPKNTLNVMAYSDAVVLYNIYKLKGIGPRIAVEVPQNLPKEAYEPFRIWVTQLWQESIGGKKDGIHPKIEIITPDTTREEKEKLKKNGFYFISFDEDRDKDIDIYWDYHPQAYMYLLATYFSAFTQIEYLGQGNVQLYKEKLKEIKNKPVESPNELNIEDIIYQIEHTKDIEKKPFIDVVLYGGYSSAQKEKVKTLLSNAFSEKIVFIYDGPDYNHHSFEALATDPYTLPVLLVKKGASDDVIRVAQATSMVFPEDSVVYATGILDEEIKNMDKLVKTVLSLKNLKNTSEVENTISNLEFGNSTLDSNIFLRDEMMRLYEESQKLSSSFSNGDEDMKKSLYDALDRLAQKKKVSIVDLVYPVYGNLFRDYIIANKPLNVLSESIGDNGLSLIDALILSNIAITGLNIGKSSDLELRIVRLWINDRISSGKKSNTVVVNDVNSKGIPQLNTGGSLLMLKHNIQRSLDKDAGRIRDGKDNSKTKTPGGIWLKSNVVETII